MSDAAKPDLKRGVPVRSLAKGAMVSGQVDGEDAILVRRGKEFFAVGASCTHYHGPLAEGLVVEDTVRCPWHHACFSLRTGEALRAPALDPVSCWRVERVGEKIFVREKIEGVRKRGKLRKGAEWPPTVVIVGGGAAGLAAAEMLRREGYDGRVTMVSADKSAPCDRPNLSKDYLAGKAQADWIPLRPPKFYRDNKIRLILETTATQLELSRREVKLARGRSLKYGAMLLGTGAEPVQLSIPGARKSQIFYLRTFADSRAIIARAESAKRVVVVGSSFIGLEVAASLRERHLEVRVVAPDKQPLEKILGAEVGKFIRGLHEEKGVKFHLGETVKSVSGRRVTLHGGATLEADFLVIGAGVRPSITLAEQAGLAIDRGVSVNEFLETSAPGVYAAGDIARWPDPHSGESIRVEHWVVAERQGQTAARNILGARERFDAVPFFWSQHYDVALNYVGHAERWDSVAIDGSLKEKNFTATYVRGGKTLAVVTVSRDIESLKAEVVMESTSR